MRNRLQSRSVVLLCLAVAFVVGCTGGSKRAAVKGRVTVDGQPVENGSISFVPADGTQGPSAGGVITAGEYDIAKADGPLIGPHRVRIIATRKTGRQVQAFSGVGPMVDEEEMFIPPRYNTATTLTAEIVPKRNEIDFELTLEE